MDSTFEEYTIEKVKEHTDGGWSLSFDGSMGCFCPAESPITPEPGMTLRLYGKGSGFRFRGMEIDGKTVFYRTEEEDEQHHKDETYGRTPGDVLTRWDEGRSVHSIEMGGIGPGYEQAIQVTAMEILRYLVDESPEADLWEDDKIWAEWRERIQTHSFANETIKGLGLSGAQYGAAVQLAAKIYMQGPQDFAASIPKDRQILVSKHFPGMAA